MNSVLVLGHSDGRPLRPMQGTLSERHTAKNEGVRRSAVIAEGILYTWSTPSWLPVMAALNSVPGCRVANDVVARQASITSVLAAISHIGNGRSP